jgi:hypothetical protein
MACAHIHVYHRQQTTPVAKLSAPISPMLATAKQGVPISASRQNGVRTYFCDIPGEFAARDADWPYPFLRSLEQYSVRLRPGRIKPSVPISAANALITPASGWF